MGSLAEDWEATAFAADGLPAGWRRHARRAHLELVRRWLGDDLDGLWLKTDLQEERDAGPRALLPALTGTWVGIDAAPSVVTAAAALGIRGAVADVRCLPFASGSFTGVLSTSTLDHFLDRSDIDVALRELRRVLRPGGRLLLTLDNPQNPLIRLRNALPRGMQQASGMVPFHVGPTYSARDGRAALLRAGFQVQDIAYLLHAPHVVGTRAARWRVVEDRFLPRLDRLAATRIAPYSGHFVAFLARAAR